MEYLPFRSDAHGLRSEAINRSVLEALAKAWNRYPLGVPLPLAASADKQLLDQVLRFFDREGLVSVTGTAAALTESGFAAVEQTALAERRMREFLQRRALPADPSAGSSLVLAILREHFKLRNA